MRERREGGLGQNTGHLNLPLWRWAYLPPFYSSMVQFPSNVTLCPQAQPIFNPPSNKSPLIPNFSSQTIFARFQKAIKRSLKQKFSDRKNFHRIFKILEWNISKFPKNTPASRTCLHRHRHMLPEKPRLPVRLCADLPIAIPTSHLEGLANRMYSMMHRWHDHCCL